MRNSEHDFLIMSFAAVKSRISGLKCVHFQAARCHEVGERRGFE